MKHSLSSLFSWLCVIEGSPTPPFIQGGWWCFNLQLARGQGCTTLAWRHAITRARIGREAPTGGRSPPRVGRPMTTAVAHHLHVVGLGLDLDHSPVVLCPGWVQLMGTFVVPLRKSASESTFQYISPSIYVCDLQNMLVPNLVESVS